MLKTIGITLIIAGLATFTWFGIGSSSNLDWVKERAAEKWASQGFVVIDYEGYKWGYGGFGTPYGGANVWYRLHKVNESPTQYYSGYIQRWGNELQVYGPEHPLY